MYEDGSNTITSFVNTDWILSLCEQEILNERMIHEGIGGRINMIAQAELRGFIRAIRKVQELTLLSITEDVVTLSCSEIGLDEHGNILLLDGQLKLSPGGGEPGPGCQQNVPEVRAEAGQAAPCCEIPRLKASSAKESRK